MWNDDKEIYYNYKQKLLQFDHRPKIMTKLWNQSIDHKIISTCPYISWQLNTKKYVNTTKIMTTEKLWLHDKRPQTLWQYDYRT